MTTSIPITQIINVDQTTYKGVIIYWDKHQAQQDPPHIKATLNNYSCFTGTSVAEVEKKIYAYVNDLYKTANTLLSKIVRLTGVDIYEGEADARVFAAILLRLATLEDTVEQDVSPLSDWIGSIGGQVEELKKRIELLEGKPLESPDDIKNGAPY